MVLELDPEIPSHTAHVVGTRLQELVPASRFPRGCPGHTPAHLGAAGRPGEDGCSPESPGPRVEPGLGDPTPSGCCGLCPTRWARVIAETVCTAQVRPRRPLPAQACPVWAVGAGAPLAHASHGRLGTRSEGPLPSGEPVRGGPNFMPRTAAWVLRVGVSLGSHPVHLEDRRPGPVRETLPKKTRVTTCATAGPRGADRPPHCACPGPDPLPGPHSAGLGAGSGLRGAGMEVTRGEADQQLDGRCRSGRGRLAGAREHCAAGAGESLSAGPCTQRLRDTLRLPWRPCPGHRCQEAGGRGHWLEHLGAARPARPGPCFTSGPPPTQGCGLGRQTGPFGSVPVHSMALGRSVTGTGT